MLSFGEGRNPGAERLCHLPHVSFKIILGKLAVHEGIMETLSLYLFGVAITEYLDFLKKRIQCLTISEDGKSGIKVIVPCCIIP